MCTAITYYSKDHYFGRNLDLEYSYQETVTVTPRNFPLCFRHKDTMNCHYGLIGMAYVAGGYPLYYDAINEKGLGMAGLNFPGNAFYKKAEEGRDNIASFEFIPWILGQCADVCEARGLLEKIVLTDDCFSEELPASPLHWMIADGSCSIVVEQTKTGLHVYDDPVGIMTNNPPFDIQLFGLNNYMNLSPEPAQNNFSKALDLDPYSRGMGAIGLPGDFSSASRFVRGAFTRMHALLGKSEEESVSRFFRILESVAQPKGSVHLGGSAYEFTIYSSCCNLDRGIYYYNTYENHQITAVDMHREDLEGQEIVSYPLRTGENILREN